MTSLTEVNGKWEYTAGADELKRMLKLGAVSPEGIIFDEELAGPEGADFILYPSSEHTQADVEATKRWLRESRDVVNIMIGKPEGEYPIPRTPPIWTPEEREAGFRKIVAEKSCMPLEDCVLVDHFTASYMVQVLDGLNPVNKAKMLSLPVSMMIDIMWKVVDGVEGRDR